MTSHPGVALRGAAGVLAAWAERDTRSPGIALMLDTAASGTGPAMPPATPSALVYNRSLSETVNAATTARGVLARALATGLAGAAQAGRYQWDGSFDIDGAIDRAAWDLLGTR